MSKTIRRLWAEESGAVISAELVLVLTLVVIALIAGLGRLSHSLAAELSDISEAIGSLDQGYEFSGMASCTGTVSGSSFNDVEDATACDCTGVVHNIGHVDLTPKCE